MKLPEEPTKKVREILVTALQCPGYKINEKDLYEIKKLCDCLDTIISTMKLHAGDCCSLNNEFGLFRGHWEDAEERCEKLEKALKLTIDRWRLIGRKVWDTKVKVSILELERQLERDVEEILKG